jgi:hypothetical protein
MATSWGLARTGGVICALFGAALAAVPALGLSAPPPSRSLPSDMPDAYVPKTDSFD